MATGVLRYFRVAVVSILLTSVSGKCYDTIVGVADGTVPDDNVNASSEFNATTPSKNGRLNYTAGSSWCALSSDSTPYLQVDLESVYIICAVATQGNSRADQWVKTYQVQYSTDGGNWTVYQEKRQTRPFQGNYDRDTVVTRLLYEAFQAQFIRVYPKTYYGGICLRLELYGLTKQVCETSEIGIKNSAKVPDYRFSASSSFNGVYQPYHARFGSSTGWTTKRDSKSNSWLQIDLGSVYILCAIETKDSGVNNGERVDKYKVNFTIDNDHWQIYQEGNQDKEFTGNRVNKEQKNVLKQVVRAKFVKIRPTVYNVFPTLRVELYGIVQACASSLGIENKDVKDSQLTASSGQANSGRLYNTAVSWCSSTSSNKEYIQVDFGGSTKLGGLATQGGVQGSSWIKTYSIAFSYDNTTWFDFKDNKSSLKIFSTANDQSSVRANWFRYPFLARYVRIFPQTWEGKPCLRFDLYGCSDATGNSPSVKVMANGVGKAPDGDVIIELVCQARGQPEPEVKWKLGNGNVAVNATLLKRSDGLIVLSIRQVVRANQCQKMSSSTRTVVCTLPTHVCIASYQPINGGSPAVSQISAVKLVVPDVVTDLRTSSVQARSAVLIWTAPNSRHALITSYKLKYSGLTTISDTNATIYMLTGLQPHTSYAVKIMAVSKLEEGMWSVTSLNFTTSESGECYETSVGVADAKQVTDINITASSKFNATTPAKNGRLNYTAGSSWCASSSDSTSYLQVDLGSVYIICAVATQGNSRADQWARTYQVQYSTNGSNWTIYQEKEQNRTFDGNYDRDTIVTNLLYEGIQARFVRISPKTHYGGICLRLDLYGLSKEVCETSAIGVSDSSIVPDYRFSASSYYNETYAPHRARFGASPGWTPTEDGRSNAWLQIDLGSGYFVCAIAIKGGSGIHNEYVQAYKLNVTMDNMSWRFYREGNQIKIFPGNSDSNTAVKNVLQHTVRAKFVRLLPTTYVSNPTVRIELYGITQACASSLGIENSKIKDSQLTASSGTAQNGRLYDTVASSWCNSTQSKAEYIQVDLGHVAKIRGIATQGNSQEQYWTMTFSIAFSYNNTSWSIFTDSQSSLKIFAAAKDQNTVQVNWFHYPFVARYVRIYQQTWKDKPCLRFDLYGCSDVSGNSPHVTIMANKTAKSLDGNVNVELECQARGQPDPEVKWQRGSTDVTSNATLVKKSHGLTVSRIPSVGINNQCKKNGLSLSRKIVCTIPTHICIASYSPRNGGIPGLSSLSTVILDVPDAVKDLRTSSVKARSAVLTWTAPDPGDAAITSYKFKYNGTTVTTDTSSTIHLLTGLQPNASYSVKIIALSKLGEGLWSATPLKFTTAEADACYDESIGMAVNGIPDDNITASSEFDAATPAENGRLRNTAGSSWCASSHDSTPYLEVDLGSVFIICAVATQGNSRADQWVKTYQVQYSTDGSNWSVYQEKGHNRTFQGNYDRSTVVTRLLYEGVQAQFIRIYPETHYNGICLRLEIYGLSKQVCETSAIGVSDRAKIPDYRFSASSFFDTRFKSYEARFGAAYGWTPTSGGRPNSWLQIDLGGAYILCAIATLGSGSSAERVEKYTVNITLDNDNWQFYREGEQKKIFAGNLDSKTVVTHVLQEVVQAKLIRIYPTEYNNYPTMRVEVYGIVQACASSLGIEGSKIKDSQLTASSGTAKSCRLYNKDGSWCSESTTFNSEYIQIDLLYFATIRGLATQGDGKSRSWLNTFSIKYSFENTSWFNFTDDHSSLKTFTAAKDKDKVKVNWFHYPFVAKHVRIFPHTWEGKPCLRFDLYGCHNVLGNSPFVTVMAKTIANAPTEGLFVELECRARGQPEPEMKWQHGSTDVTDHATLVKKSDGLIVSELGQKISLGQCRKNSSLYRTVVCDLPTYTCLVSYPPINGDLPGFARISAAKLEVPDAVRDLKTSCVQARSVILEWTAPDHGDAAITLYKFRYSGKTVRSDTSSTHYQLTDLQHNTLYNVNIVAVSKLGDGLWNAVPLNVTTAMEDAKPPHEVEVTKIEKRNVTVGWKEPRQLASRIAGYKVQFEGFKSYNSSFRHAGIQETNSQVPTKLVVTNLVPGTQYHFRVAIKNGCSELKYSDKSEAATKFDDPISPNVPFVLNDTKSGVTLTVTVWPVRAENGPISSYQIIVLHVKQKGDTLPDDYAKYLHDVSDAERAGLNFYITADIPAKDILTETSFTVGDNKIHGTYLNAKLKEGESYKIFMRALTNVDEVTYAGQYKLIAEVTTTKARVSPSGSLPLIIGLVFAVIIVTTFIVGVVLFLRRRNRQEQSKAETGGPLPLQELAGNDNNANNASHLVEDLGNEFAPRVNLVKKKVATESAGVSESGAAASGAAIYSNVFEEEEHKPIPAFQFGEYINRIKRGNYARLRQEYKTFPKDKQFPWTVAEKPEYKKYNRYRNIIAYDHSRVVLEPSVDNVNYINANRIHGWDDTPNTYIATQGPVPATVSMFWMMIWNENAPSVIMVTNVIENGKTKCHRYWPERDAKYGVITVSLHKTEVFADFTIRTFLLKKGSENRTVFQFHFTIWPDHGVPRLPSNLLSMIRRVRAKSPKDRGPVVVHCSAGVGRTGAYIVIDAMIEQAKEKHSVDIYNYLQTIRKDRIHLVQTEEQYVFIHKAIHEVLTCGDTEVSAEDMRLAIRKLAATKPGQDKTGYGQEFERLGFASPNASKEECEVGWRPDNLNKSRNQDLMPLDIARVILKRPNADDNYINASFADAFKERDAFILTQAPLPDTIEDFWQMVYDYAVGSVVMLNTLEEEELSYPQYWPDNENNYIAYGDITVQLTSQKARGDVILRHLTIKDKKSKNRPHKFRHLQHLAWPDHFVPANHQSVLDLVTMVMTALQQSGNASLVVQCSDGVGRSGTFCAIYSILERVKLEQVVDVFQAIKVIRVKRPLAVETLSQYKFCYEIVQRFLDSFSAYANFSDC